MSTRALVRFILTLSVLFALAALLAQAPPNPPAPGQPPSNPPQTPPTSHPSGGGSAPLPGQPSQPAQPPASPAAPAPPTSTTSSIGQVDLKEFPKVCLFVSVLDQDGRSVQGMTSSGFNVAENGQPAAGLAVENAVNKNLPMAVVIIIDVSGSMMPALDLEKQAVKNFVDKMKPDDEAAVISFSDMVTITQPFTKDKSLLDQKVDDLAILGNTSLFDAISAGMRLSSEQSGYRRAVVVFTDGQDNRSSSTLVDVLDSYRRLSEEENKSFTVFTIGLGMDINKPELGEIAERCGGRFLDSPTPDQLDAVYQAIISQLLSEYIVSYTSPLQSGRGQLVTVQLTSSVGGVSSSAKAVYRTPGLGAQIAMLSWPGIILAVILLVVLVVLTIFKMNRAVWITAMITPLEGKDYVVRGDDVNIGRDEYNEVCLRMDRSILPYHARMKNTRDGFVLEALDANAPILAGGRYILRKLLRDKDEFILGGTRFIFHERILRTGEHADYEVQAGGVPSLAVEQPGFAPSSLRGVSGPYSGQTFKLKDGANNIGRVEGDIVLGMDQTVSRKHCSIERAATGLMIADAGSTNGTFVNGVRLAAQSPLFAGDSVTIGGSTFVVE